MLRLALFFNNHNTLGHATKSLLLVKTIKKVLKNKVRILVFENGIQPLGAFSFSKYGSWHFVPSFNDSPSLKANFGLLKESLDRFKPHVFITEYYPFSDNLNFLLFRRLFERLKAKHGTKILSSFTHINWSENLEPLIRGYYDLLLYHYPEDLDRGTSVYLPKQKSKMVSKILSENRDKILYTGFLCDDTENTPVSLAALKKRLVRGHKRLIVVSRGGRDEHEKMILLALLSARRHKDWFFLVSTGPFCREREFNNYLKISEKMDNVRIKKIIFPGFDNCLAAADLSINMGGYSTMVRLLRFNKRSIVCPADDAEQLWNARLLTDLSTSESVLPGELQGADLEKKILRLLPQKPKSLVQGSWFHGAQQTAEIIKRFN